MTRLLEKAVSEAAKLSHAEQDALGQLLLDELGSEERWRSLFAGSQDVLAKLADEALEEHRRGETEELVPDKL
jgi:hypothetical protein